MIVNLIKTIFPSKVNTCRTGVKDVKDISLAIPRSSSSPTQLPYAEDATSTSTLSAIKENTAQGLN
jgi:hypothetical protein